MNSSSLFKATISGTGSYLPEKIAALKETAEFLRKNGGRTSDWRNAGESIHIAVKAGHFEAVKKHFDKGADVNQRNGVFEGDSPLFHAVMNGFFEITELLIAKGADVNAKDEDGLTPLDLAIEFKKTEAAYLLRKHGGKTSEELKAEGK